MVLEIKPLHSVRHRFRYWQIFIDSHGAATPAAPCRDLDTLYWDVIWLGAVELGSNCGGRKKQENMLDWIAASDLRSGDATQIIPQLQPSIDRDSCFADLTAAQWVGPATMVALAAFLDRQSRHDRGAFVRAPHNPNLANYLSRMGFGDLLDEMHVPHDLPPVNSDSALSAKSLVEVSRFSTSAEVNHLVELIDYQSVPSELAHVLAEALLEAGTNVPEHASVEHGFMSAQVLEGGRVLRLAVADGGVGMLHTLSSRGAQTERQALNLAIEGTSETGIVGRGKGIPSIHRSLKEHRGTGILLSGGSILTMNPHCDRAWTFGYGMFPGTVLDACVLLA